MTETIAFPGRRAAAVMPYMTWVQGGSHSLETQSAKKEVSK